MEVGRHEPRHRQELGLQHLQAIPDRHEQVLGPVAHDCPANAARSGSAGANTGRPAPRRGIDNRGTPLVPPDCWSRSGAGRPGVTTTPLPGRRLSAAPGNDGC